MYRFPGQNLVKPRVGAYREGLNGAPMPKLPDDMSQAAIKKREVISAATKAKPKTEEAAPPKPRMAKKR
jgi:hypothetical protein